MYRTIASNIEIRRPRDHIPRLHRKNDNVKYCQINDKCKEKMFIRIIRRFECSISLLSLL